MKKSRMLWGVVALALSAGACARDNQPTPQHPTRGAEATMGQTSPSGVQAPPCPGDTVAQVQQYPNNPQPPCKDQVRDGQNAPQAQRQAPPQPQPQPQ